MKTARLDTSAYQAAERLLRHNRGGLVLGDRISPQWIDGGARFWYAVDTCGGRRFVLVDPEAGTREPAFDHERLATALAAASGQDVDAAALPFGAIAARPAKRSSSTRSARTGDAAGRLRVREGRGQPARQPARGPVAGPEVRGVPSRARHLDALAGGRPGAGP